MDIAHFQKSVEKTIVAMNNNLKIYLNIRITVGLANSQIFEGGFQFTFFFGLQPLSQQTQIGCQSPAGFCPFAALTRHPEL